MPQEQPRRRGAQPCGLTQAEIARRLGITRARVYQLEKRALKKLARSPLLKQLARDYGLGEGES